MGRKITRKELNIKYVEYPRIHFDYNYNPTKEELIKFYKDRIKAIINLMKDLKNVMTTEKENCAHSIRQVGCIYRIQNDDHGWENETDIYEQKYFEMTDYIFYNEESVDDKNALSNIELATIGLMARLLVEIAKKRILELEK